MKLNLLPKITTRRSKRLGRGYGSGKGGHTAGRGQKGQKTRTTVPAWFEGGQLPFIRRLPFIKGKNRFKSLHADVFVLNVGQFESFKAGSNITVDALVKAGLLPTNLKQASVKVLGRGQITKALTVSVPTSPNAKEKIEKAGGKIEEPKQKTAKK